MPWHVGPRPAAGACIRHIVLRVVSAILDMLRIGLAGRYLCSKMEASRGRSLSNAILALGGNVGNVAGNFERGLQSLEEQGIKVSMCSTLSPDC